jgi:hypothetical protein
LSGYRYSPRLKGKDCIDGTFKVIYLYKVGYLSDRLMGFVLDLSFYFSIGMPPNCLYERWRVRYRKLPKLLTTRY